MDKPLFFLHKSSDLFKSSFKFLIFPPPNNKNSRLTTNIIDGTNVLIINNSLTLKGFLLL